MKLATGEYTYYSVDGQVAFTTAANQVYYLDSKKTTAHVISNKNTGGVARTLIVEARGYIAVKQGNDYWVTHLAQFESFNFKEN